MRIRVGIIGANPDRGWAMRGHIPALRALSADYELTAVSTTRRASADAARTAFGVARAYDNHAELVNDDAVDVVVIAVKVSEHLELATAALNAGKAVYCEWPLGNGLAEAEAMADLAAQRGVLAVAGLQARAAPAIAYVRDLLAQGYVGDVLSTTLVGSGMNWGATVEAANAYTNDKVNGATMLAIPFGHTVDALAYCLGEPAEVNAITAMRRTSYTIAGTTKTRPMAADDQVLVSGVLEGGATFSAHYRGGASRGTNLLWEINGTRGDLQLTATGGHAQLFELTVRRGTGVGLEDLPVPPTYRSVAPIGVATNLAEAYVRFARDYRDGTSLCPTFADGVIRHRMLHAIETAAATGQRQRCQGTPR